MREVNGRTVDADRVDDLFVTRWSPRSFTEEIVDDERFAALIEAARWAPSSSNNQPWRFVYAARGSGHWDSFVSCLNEGNREWAHRASHLVILVRKETTERGTPYATSAFDCGAAWMSFALQAQMLDLATHAMGGFDKDAARNVADIPDGFSPVIMIALGVRGDGSDLPEHRKESEQTRSRRKAFNAIASEGAFAQEWN